MMDDKELLEQAAKAYGISHWYGKEGTIEWNPLNDDSDALKLAVKLGISLQLDCDPKMSFKNKENFVELDLNNHYAATRRAIVRAAAEIGRRCDANIHP